MRRRPGRRAIARARRWARMRTVVGSPRRTPRPRLLVLVVGETVRAQNWGLNGYARQTTPQLQQIAPINFTRRQLAAARPPRSRVPCMFSPYGPRALRQGPDQAFRIAAARARARRHPHAVARQPDRLQGRLRRPGVRVVRARHDPQFCNGDGCLDEVMLQRPERRGRRRNRATWSWSLHQLGNHGPSYYKRYPPRLRRFTPACETSELGDCSREQIVNAYDNAVLHTDDFLAQHDPLPGRAEPIATRR